MEMVTLKNGISIAMETLVPVYRNLKRLQQAKVMPFTELVMRARDPSYTFWDATTMPILRKYNLIELDGSFHPDKLQIILNSVEGEGLNMRIINPLDSGIEVEALDEP